MRVVVKATIGSVVALRSSEIEHLEVIQELGSHTECQLFFTRDKDTDLSLDAMLGQPLTVTLEDDIGTVTVFTGAVTGGSQNHQINHGSAFSLEGMSPSSQLERRTTEYFPASTFSDIVGRFGAKLIGSAPSGDPLEYLQYGETDFSFLKRVADENGMFLRTTGEKIEVRSQFEDIGPTLVWGRDLLSVTAEVHPANHGNSGAAHYHQEKRDHRFRGIRKDASWFNGAARMTAAASRLANSMHDADGDSMVHELPYRSKTLAASRAYLEQESVRALGTSVFVDAVGNNLRVRAGDSITLEESEAFALPTRGKLGVIRVSHEFDGHLYSNSFTATPWENWSNRERPERAQIPGPVSAMVIENVDPERMGRLKVRMHWQDVGKATRWVRMVQPYSGNDRGFHFLPEIGDEVLVGFELGDPERPVILGALWNGKDKAQTMDKNEAKRIVTRSGNTIQMFDTEGKEERIEIYSATGQCWIQLANNGGKPLITIHSEGDISLEAKEEIRLKCKSLVERVDGNAYRKITGDSTFEVSGKHTEKVSGDLVMNGMNVTVKAGGMLDAVAGGIHSIVGSMVHIQPPGKMVMPAMVNAPSEPQSPWKETKVPEAADEKSSEDAKTR
jgi:Rhs element Vgr protein